LNELEDVTLQDMKNKTFCYLFCAAVLCFVSSCKDQIADPNVNPIVFPDSNVSYSKHVDLLFQQRCALSGCHAGSAAQAGLDLLTPSYSSLINHQPRLVVSGASNNSLLAQRIDGRLAPQMPYMSQPLNANQIAGIKKWIDEGAKNN
jgi:hypothetical protein